MAEQTYGVLVLCAANLCRSPTAMLLLGDRLPESLRTHLRITSAGIAAVAGREWCADARRWAVRQGLPDAAGLEHRSRAVTHADLSASGLVLCADRSVRSAVIRSAPYARARIFTLAEAADLAEASVRDLRPESTSGRFDWLVEEMDARRGLLGVRPPDVVDAHAGRRSGHPRAMRGLLGAVTSLAGSLETVLRPPGA